MLKCCGPLVCPNRSVCLCALTQVAGGIRNVTFSNVRIHGADGHPSSGAIKFKLPCGRGAYVTDVLYEDITADNVASPSHTGCCCTLHAAWRCPVTLTRGPSRSIPPPQGSIKKNTHPKSFTALFHVSRVAATDPDLPVLPNV